MKINNFILKCGAFLLSSLVVALALYGVVSLFPKSNPALGSVSIGGEYHSTTTGTAMLPNVPILLQTGQGTFGSVVVTGPTPGFMNTAGLFVFDATTSVQSQRSPFDATSTIMLAHIPAGIATSTYTFDTAYTRGLLIVPGSSVPTTTITFR